MLNVPQGLTVELAKHKLEVPYIFFLRIPFFEWTQKNKPSFWNLFLPLRLLDKIGGIYLRYS